MKMVCKNVKYIRFAVTELIATTLVWSVSPNTAAKFKDIRTKHQVHTEKDLALNNKQESAQHLHANGMR